MKVFGNLAAVMVLVIKKSAALTEQMVQKVIVIAGILNFNAVLCLGC